MTPGPPDGPRRAEGGGSSVLAALRAPFADDRALAKVGLASLLYLLVLTGPAVIGYYLQYALDVASDPRAPLPRWERFGAFWLRGLLVALGAAILAVPAVVAILLGAQATAAAPVLLLAAAIYAIWAGVPFSGAMVEYARTKRFLTLLDVPAAWRRVRVPGYWRAWLFELAAAFGLTALEEAFYPLDARLGTVGADFRPVATVLLAPLTVLAYLMGAYLYGLWIARVAADEPSATAVDAVGLRLEYLASDDPRLAGEVARLRNDVLIVPFGLEPIDWADDGLAESRLAAYEGDRLVGYACLMGHEGGGRIRQVTVAFDRQRSGVGSAMVRELVADARRRGLDPVWLASRLPAVRFYERLGFEIVGEEYIDGAVNLPHVRMELVSDRSADGARSAPS